MSGLSGRREHPLPLSDLRHQILPRKVGPPPDVLRECSRFPCRRMKNLEKRYLTRYGVDIGENLRKAAELGVGAFLEQVEKECACPACGAVNPHSPPQ